jgi:hypothetical protein
MSLLPKMFGYTASDWEGTEPGATACGPEPAVYVAAV